MSGYQSGGNYYNEIIADPKDVDRVYAVDTILQVTENGGTSFGRVGEERKHVDNHSVWIDPGDTDHLLVGCDGGVYETYDRGRTWRYMANLPITQFYRVATDTTKPFYRVYGGAQDNFSVGGPSRTRTVHGITNADWFITPAATASAASSIRKIPTRSTRSRSSARCRDSTWPPARLPASSR